MNDDKTSRETGRAERSNPLSWLGWLLALVFAVVAAGLAHKVATVRGELNTARADRRRCRSNWITQTRLWR